jgi:hypothetical protein
MMKRLFLVWLAVIGATVGQIASVSADVIGQFPDGSVAGVLPAGPFGAHVNLFWDVSGDRDLFVFNADAAANPLLVPVLGLPALAYWLNFLGVDGAGRLVFDVYATQGAGFFFVMRWSP